MAHITLTKDKSFSGSDLRRVQAHHLQKLALGFTAYLAADGLSLQSLSAFPGPLSKKFQFSCHIPLSWLSNKR